MRAYQRLLKYITYETMADARSETIPSSPGQTALAKALLEEVRELGVTDVVMDDKSYVYGKIPSNLKDGDKLPVLGFIAHLDTANTFCGPGDTARMIEHYDGAPIVLDGEVILDPAEYPALKASIGEDLIVTNGETLLGGDDKAGVAEIMTAIEYLMTHPDDPHGEIAFAFTPDEEIGGSTRNFDLKKFGADFAYTLDGEEFGTLEYENFCNGAVQIEIKGVSAHPGYAKGIMKNALNIANEFHSLLPPWDRPEHTENYDGFYHLVQMEGSPQQCKTAYLFKDFEQEGFLRRKEKIEEIAEYLNREYGEGTISLEFLEGKMNMALLMEKHMHLIQFAKEEIANCGTTAEVTPMRGGTDGVALTFEGLPCPNLGTGSYNHHSVYEFANVQKMDKCVELILRLIGRYAKYEG